MINVLRKNQKALWVVIGLLCIPFVFYFSKSPFGKMQKDELGEIYGHTVTNVEFQRSMRLLNLAQSLGMSSFLQSMVAGATSENQMYTVFTWNRLILQHEAERLGIAATHDEILQKVRALPALQGAQGFDAKKYTDLADNTLPALGFTEAQVEELAGDEVKLEKLKKVVTAGASVPEAEAKDNFERAYGKLNVAVVRVTTEDAAKEVQVSDDDAAKYYEAHKAELKTEEARKVSFVSLGLNDEQKKLAGKERVEALQKMADKANDFNQALLEKGAQFEQVAAKFQVPAQTTAEFTKTKPDPLLTANAQLTEAAFQLKLDEPNSDAMQAGDGFYVMHLLAVQPAQPLSLEQAKPKIVEMLKKQRTQQLLAAKGTMAGQEIREALKSGTSLDAALQKTGLPSEKIPPFALSDPPQPRMAEAGKPAPPPEAPDLRMIKGAVAEMQPGEVSAFTPTPTGGFVAVLEKRDPPDPANYATAKATFSQRVLQSQKEIAFYEWMKEQQRAAGVASKAVATEQG